MAQTANKPKRILLLALKFLVSGTLLFFVLRKAGFKEVYSLISRINPLAFLAAVLFYALGQLVSSARWRLLLTSRVPMKRLFSLYMVGSFFSMILPGLVGGDAVKGFYLYKDTGKAPETMASIFMERYLGFTALLILGALAYPFSLPYIKGSPLAWYFPLIVAAFLVFSLAFFNLKIGRRIKMLSEVYGYFGLYRKPVLARGVLLSFGVQGLAIISVITISKGLGLSIPVPLFFAFVPMIVAFSSLPVSVSGIGLREASFVLLFGGAGLNAESAAAMSFSWYLSMMACSLIGAVEYLRLHKKG